MGGGFMIEPRSKQERGLRPGHKVTVVAVAVIAALVAYVALHAIVGLIAFFIKTVLVLAVIGGVLYLVFRHAGKRRF
jgi:high-affinity Fe2+/Pb2+ permease